MKIPKLWLSILLFVSSVLAFGLAGCRKGRPTTCKGWAKYVQSPVLAQRAIKQLGKLRCKENLKDLERIFPDSDYKDLILQAVRQIRAPKASVGILKLALANPRTAVLGAAVVEELKVVELRNRLKEILKDPKYIKARLNALSALSSMDKGNMKQDKDVLIFLLQADPKAQDIRINSRAAKLLGEMRCKDAIGPMIATIFKRDAAGRQVYVPIRMALSKIGPAAEPPIEAVLRNDTKGKYAGLIKKVAKVAKEYGLYDWQWKNAPELVQVLTDLRVPQSKVILTDLLTAKLNMPAGLDQKALNLWKITEQNKITMAMLGLWNVGDESVLDKLVAGILDPENDVLQRLRMATVIALIPSPKAVEALMEIYKKTKDGRFRAPLLKPLALAMDATHVKAYNKMLAKDKDPAVRERLDGKGPDSVEYRTYMGVLRMCSDDPNCYMTKLKSKDMRVVQKAVLMLIRSKSADRKKVLNALIGEYPKVPPKTQEGIDARRYILTALWRMGDKTIIPKLKEIRDNEAQAQTARFWVNEIQTLIDALGYKQAGK